MPFSNSRSPFIRVLISAPDHVAQRFPAIRAPLFLSTQANDIHLRPLGIGTVAAGVSTSGKYLAVTATRIAA